MATLPDLVDRLQAGGSDAAGSFSQDELETVIDDLPLALESEAMRSALPDLVARIEHRQQRTFRRIIEIARQVEDHTTLLLAALRRLPWTGSPTEDEFAWLISQLNRIDDPEGRRDAFERMSTLTLHGAQVSMLDALATSHYDAEIREVHAARRNAAAPAAPARELTAEMVEDSARRAEESTAAIETVAPATAPAPRAETAPVADADAAMDWSEEKQPERLTVRTLLRSLDPAVNLAGSAPAPASVAEADPEAEREPEAEPVVESAVVESAAAASPEAEPESAPAEPVTVAEDRSAAWPDSEPTYDEEPSVFDEPPPSDPFADAAEATAGDFEITPPPPPASADGDDPEAAAPVGSESVWDEADGPEPPRVTVRTLLRSLDTVRVGMPPPIPDEEPVPVPVPSEPDAAIAESAPEAQDDGATSVMGMLRSLDTVRVSLMDLEAAKMSMIAEAQAAMPSDPSGGTATAPPVEAEPEVAPPPAPRKPDAPPPPWASLELTAQSPPERARRLSRVRREITTPEQRRQYLGWLFQSENDATFGPSIRKELLEFAFERPTFLAFDGATRARLGRWIRERAAGEAIPAAAVLAALRRAMWSDGEPPVVDDQIRPLVDAASGCLVRATPDERLPLLGRDFSVWLFAVREIEDREALDKWARDPQPAVVEGVFRALAAMDALAARVGGTGDGPTALQLALGVWDRADIDARMQMAHGIAAGWSRGFVLDRATFFEAFWKRAQENPIQKDAVMIALASFDKELEAIRAKDRVAAEPPAAAQTAPPSPEPEPIAPAMTAVPAQEPGVEPTDPEARPSPAAAESASAPVSESPFAPDRNEETENTTERYFRLKREEIERGMRPPERAEARTSSSAGVRMDARVAEMDDEQTEDEFDAIPDEGDDVLADDGYEVDPEVAARRRGKTNPGIRVTPRPLDPEPEPASAAPTAKPVKAHAPEDDIVLPGEPLRTLGEYTAFLKALSAGSPIDELLDRHGMDYKQYAACMTSWGKVLQNRPELALRMGQLLRG